jgi:hypothetical protein
LGVVGYGVEHSLDWAGEQIEKQRTLRVRETSMGAGRLTMAASSEAQGGLSPSPGQAGALSASQSSG